MCVCVRACVRACVCVCVTAFASTSRPYPCSALSGARPNFNANVCTSARASARARSAHASAPFKCPYPNACARVQDLVRLQVPVQVHAKTECPRSRLTTTGAGDIQSVNKTTTRHACIILYLGVVYFTLPKYYARSFVRPSFRPSVRFVRSFVRLFGRSFGRSCFGNASVMQWRHLPHNQWLLLFKIIAHGRWQSTM